MYNRNGLEEGTQWPHYKMFKCMYNNHIASSHIATWDKCIKTHCDDNLSN